LETALGELGGVVAGSLQAAEARQGFAGQLNDPPEPLADLIQRESGQGITVTAASLLANDRDPEGDPFELTAVDSTSANGATVAWSGDDLEYLPNGAPDAPDSFKYVVTDDAGNRAEGLVRVRIVGQTTAARLDYFRAVRAEAGTVTVVWRTLVEVQVLGFAVERQTTAGWFPVNSQLIPAAGWDQRPHSYQLEDPAAADAYRLIEIDLHGRRRLMAETTVSAALVLAFTWDDGSLVVVIRGERNEAVTLETADHLSTGAWVAERTAVLDGDGLATICVPVSATPGERLYRARWP